MEMLILLGIFFKIILIYCVYSLLLCLDHVLTIVLVTHASPGTLFWVVELE